MTRFQTAQAEGISRVPICRMCGGPSGVGHACAPPPMAFLAGFGEFRIWRMGENALVDNLPTAEGVQKFGLTREQLHQVAEAFRQAAERM